MWNQSFFNFCFLMLLLSVLAARHPSFLIGQNDETDSESNNEMSQMIVRPAEITGAVSFLETTWRRAMVMREWLLEFNSSQWEIFNAANPAETDLLDARFHLSNAEVLADAMSENDRAVTELTRAENSLHAVQTLIDPRLDPQLKTLETEIIAAEKSRPDVVLSTVPFENMKTELDHLIQTVRTSET
ncbi:MAG TPA: hypothetical protein VF452_23070 [Candidatus Binatia bacterium]